MEGKEAVYKFDALAVVTFDVSTRYGLAAARQAANSIETYEPGYGIDASATEAADVRFHLTCVAPRGRTYLVEAEPEPDNGSDTSATAVPMPEPILGEHRDALIESLNEAVKALEGDSNDAEHDALYDLAAVVAAALGTEFNPKDPYGDDV